MESALDSRHVLEFNAHHLNDFIIHPLYLREDLISVTIDLLLKLIKDAKDKIAANEILPSVLRDMVRQFGHIPVFVTTIPTDQANARRTNSPLLGDLTRLLNLTGHGPAVFSDLT